MTKLSRRYTKWTEADIDLLREASDRGLSSSTIAVLLKRTPRGVSYRLSKLGLLRDPSLPWTSEELDILRNECKNGTSVVGIAEKVDRTKAAIGAKIRSLKLKHPSVKWWDFRVNVKPLNPDYYPPDE